MIAAAHFAGLSLVGFDAGDGLAAASRQGFRMVGRLVVWTKDATA
jgi:hypothetical protein